MDVSVSTFYEELSQYKPKLLSGNIKTIQYFRPIYHGIENGFSSENLYIGSVSQLPPVPPDSPCCYMLLQDISFPKNYKKAKHNTYILISKKHSNLDMFALASGIFENQVMVGLLSAELLQSVKTKAEIKDILHQGYTALQMPLVLLDRFFNVISSVGPDVREFPALELQKLFNPHNQISPNQSSDYAIYEANSNNEWLLAGRLMRDGNPSAYLIGVSKEKRVSDRLWKLFHVLCNFMELRMQNDELYRPDSYASGNSFLHELLIQKPTDKAFITKRAERIGMRFYDYIFVLAIEKYNDNAFEDQLRLLNAQLRSVLGSYYWIIEKNCLLILYDSKKKEPFSDGQKERLESLLKQMGFTALISTPFTELQAFPQHCAQALTGLAVANRIGCSAPVIPYQDLAVDHMLVCYEKEMNLNMMIPEEIQLLYRMDEEKKTDFIHTLFCYVDYGFDANKTAKVLHIHYNTLKYRIVRISEITGIDLTDSANCTRLWLVKHALTLQGREI